MEKLEFTCCITKGSCQRLYSKATLNEEQPAMSKQIEPNVLSLALDAMSKEDFEMFAQVFMEDRYGKKFEPTGGMHDGGQDGFFVSADHTPSEYVQISKQKDIIAKIRKTLRRLKETNRNCGRLFYITNLDYPEKDITEPKLEKEFGTSIKIIDKKPILISLIESPPLYESFCKMSAAAINNILDISKSEISNYSNADRLSIVTYMEIHSIDQPNQQNYLKIAADAAIYFALEGTGHELEIFKTDEEIFNIVYEKCPAIQKANNINMPARLQRLSTKSGKPRIRKYNDGRYCLPYEIRDELNTKNILIKTAEAAFLSNVRKRAEKILCNDSQEYLSEIERVTFIAINETFKEQSVRTSTFISSNDYMGEVSTYTHVESAISNQIKGNNRILIKDICCTIISNIFYSGTLEEREYLYSLFKLYSTEFILSGDNNVARYFKHMVRKLRLIVGTDLIVRAFSEYCLDTGSQATVNMLKMLQKAGAKLYVTDSIIDELYAHIRTTINDYEQDYKPWENHATIAATKNSHRILIRAYFYAKLSPSRHKHSPQSWSSYINKIAADSWFDKSKEGRANFKKLVLRRFKFERLSKDQIVSVAKEKRVKQLTSILENYRDFKELAKNDAMLACYVNSYRDKHDEESHENIHGLSTWWLTEEHRVVTEAKKIGMRANFVMDPQFLMHYFVAHPSMRKISEDNKTSFPLHFGLRITERARDSDFRKFLKSVSTLSELDDDVAAVRLQNAANKLKSSEHYYPQ